MPIKSVKMKISKKEKEKKSFFLMSQGSLNPKTHENEYRGYPLRVSGFFPSTYHQGSVQLNNSCCFLTSSSVNLSPIVVSNSLSLSSWMTPCERNQEIKTQNESKAS